MFELNKINWDKKRLAQFTDVRNIILYIFGIFALAFTWSGIKSVQNNYELQKQISQLKQQNAVFELENENTALQNKYLQTDQYLELAARQNLGLAAPGEKVLVVPKSTAMKYVDQSLDYSNNKANTKVADNRSKYAKNLESWRDFLLGRKLDSN